MLVVDASVVVKAIVIEQDSERAIGHFASDTALIAPAHCLAEVAETLARKIRLDQVVVGQVEIVFPHIMRAIAFKPVEELVRPAMTMSLETGASVYDCLYVALAESEGCRLVTADRRLVEKLKATRFAALIRTLNSSTGSP